MIKSSHRIFGLDTQPQALVAFVRNSTELDADPVNHLALREQVAPLADWVEVDISTGLASQRQSWLQRELSIALGRKHMRFDQLVMLGWHDTARIALDLILKGAISCAGMVAVDVPCTLPRDPIAETAASIRIVRHDDAMSRTEAGLIDALRQQDADIRLMNLPAGGAHARDVTTRATATFLSELTAKACRQSPASKRSSHV
jgi:hypothetical protein